MEGNKKLKDISIKNHTCHYFNDMMNFKDFEIDHIVINEKLYQNVLIKNIS